MKATSLFLVALVHASAALAIPGSGIGASCNQAVEDAELDALRSTGNMVMHSSSTTDGKYSSSTQQYSSGIVDKRTVLSCERDGPVYRANVEVELRIGKNNVITTPTVTDDTWIRDYQAARANVGKQQQFVAAFDELSPFALTPGSLTTRVMGQQTEYRINYTAQWQPKLISDVRQYAELSGVSISQPSNQPYTLCFASYKRGSTEACFGLLASIPGIDRQYIVKLKAKQGTALIEQQHVMADNRMRFVSNEGTIVFSDGGTQGEFVLYVDTAEPLTVESMTIEAYRPATFSR